ncbi:CapA family protein [Nannocystaceae bacterium ST9]
MAQRTQAERRPSTSPIARIVVVRTGSRAPTLGSWVRGSSLTIVALLGCSKPAPIQAVSRDPVTEPTPIAGDEREPDPKTTMIEVEPAPWVLPDDYLRFAGACTDGQRRRLVFAGDLLLHQELQKQAYKSKQGAAVIWSNVADLLEQADLTALNLEGPMAPGLDRDSLEVPDPGRTYDRIVYTAYPRFNYHPSIAGDLKQAGVDLVTTANNHALDRGSLGVDRTIASLDAAHLRHVGTREQAAPERWYTISKLDGIEIGFIACTLHTNQRPDDLGQVLRCGDGKAVSKLIATLRGDLHRGGKRKPKVDAVIVLPHWGKEYSHEPRESDRAMAQAWIDAGAIAVIGSHTHVVQPLEKRIGEDGHEGLVAYSLGNFASHQPELARRSSLLLYLDLVQPEGGEVAIAGVRWLPLHVRQSGQEFFVEAIDRVQAPVDARALLVALLGASNLVLPDEAKIGDPHCDEAWRPHAVPDWAVLPEPFVLDGEDGETGEADE